MTGCVISMTGFVLYITGFVLNMTGLGGGGGKGGRGVGRGIIRSMLPTRTSDTNIFMLTECDISRTPLILFRADYK